MHLLTLCLICLSIPIIICGVWFVLSPNPFAILIPVPTGIAGYLVIAYFGFRAQEKYDKENGHMGFDEAGFAKVVEDFNAKKEEQS